MNKHFSFYQRLFFCSILCLLCILCFSTTTLGKSKVKSSTAKAKNNSKSILSNASLKVKGSINPWNFTFTLKSKRILLTKEVYHSKISLQHKGKAPGKITAYFHSLSQNGKLITYKITTKDQKKLCPKTGSANGTYTLSSSLFSKKMSITYQERLEKKTLAGYVYEINHTPLKKALVTLKTSSGTKKSHTDNNGFYKIKSSSAPSSITVTKKGYVSKTLSTPFFSQKGASCENFILRPASSPQNLTLDFKLSDVQNKPISGANITILPTKVFKRLKSISTQSTEGFPNDLASFKDSDIIFQGATDSKGTLCLTTGTTKKSLSCSHITIHNSFTLSYDSKYSSPGKNLHKISSQKITTKDTYTALIQPQTNGSVFYENCTFTFSFSQLITNQIAFHVTLKESPALSWNTLTITKDKEVSTDLFDQSSSLSLSLYTPFYSTPVYESSAPLKDFSSIEQSLSALSLHKRFSLSDGVYYIKLYCRNSSGNLIALTDISPVTVKNHLVMPASLILQSPFSSRAIIYTEQTPTLPEPLRINLYETIDGISFLINSISAKDFQPVKSGMYKADLILDGLLDNHSYKLKGDNFIWDQKELSFSPQYSQSPDFLHDLPPIAKMQFLSYEEKKESSQKYSCLSYWDHSFSLTNEVLRNCNSYPNCVITFHKKNGTFLTKILTCKPASYKDYFLENGASIVTIYGNHQFISTNQSSYK